jgi:mRNA-degrading endonuclease RelE of RelBE toxin-antitoxin system
VAIRTELVPYTLSFNRNARKALNALSIENASRVIEALQRLAETAVGDIEFLGAGYVAAYQLRVGDLRIFLDVGLEPPTLYIEALEKRGEAYKGRSRKH